MIDPTTPIEKLELRKRTTNALRNDNYNTVSDLLTAKRSDVRRAMGLGKIGFAELEEVLRHNGYSIGEAIPQKEAAPTKGRWRPIETAPKDGREILTYGCDPEGDEYFWVSGWWPFPTHEKGHWTCWHISDWATHWMPLPQRPDEQ